MVDEELINGWLYDAGKLGGLTFIACGDSDLQRKLRVEELEVFALTLYEPWRLPRGWREYGFSDLLCC